LINCNYFIDNKYKVWYEDIILKASRRKIIEGIFEKHHIIPKSKPFNGTDDPENIVKLTPREHYICHRLLVKFCRTSEAKNKMLWALHRMCFSGNYGSPSRLYEQFRIEFINNLKINHPSKTNPEEFSRKSSEAMTDFWKYNEIRREEFSNRMKKTWENNREKLLSHSLKNLEIINSIPRTGKNNPNVKEIEYKGNIYYGWRELRDKTGITKDIYKNYYEKGLEKPVIEYKGKIFSTWLELYNETRVTKKQYELYYLNGADPELYRNKHYKKFLDRKENQ
jgi:hypothetical protein